MRISKWLSALLCVVLIAVLLPYHSVVLAAESWLWPAEGCMIVSSNFGWRDLQGNDGIFDDMHNGIDIIASSNTSGRPVRASKSGTIVEGYNKYADGTFMKNSMGNYTMINHGDGTYSVYMHMKPNNLISGTVKQGDVIGYIGKTGESYATHLHFEIFTNKKNRKGSSLNPMPTNSNIKVNNIGRYALPDGWATQKTTYIFDASSSSGQQPVSTWIKASCGSTAKAGDNITLTWGAADAASYWLHIYKDGVSYISAGQESRTSWTGKFSEAGSYTCYLTPYGKADYISSSERPNASVSFTIAASEADKPSNIWLIVNPNSDITSSDLVSFSWGGNNVKNYNLRFTKDGSPYKSIVGVSGSLYQETFPVGSYRVEIEGVNGRYSLSEFKYFTVSKPPIVLGLDNVQLQFTGNTPFRNTYYYTGEPIIPSYKVVYNDVELVKDRDYKVSLNNNTSLGAASLIVTGIGEYTGTCTKYFNIVDKAWVDIEVKEDQQRPGIGIITVTLHDKFDSAVSLYIYDHPDHFDPQSGAIYNCIDYESLSNYVNRDGHVFKYEYYITSEKTSVAVGVELSDNSVVEYWANGVLTNDTIPPTFQDLSITNVTPNGFDYTVKIVDDSPLGQFYAVNGEKGIIDHYYDAYLYGISMDNERYIIEKELKYKGNTLSGHIDVKESGKYYLRVIDCYSNSITIPFDVILPDKETPKPTSKPTVTPTAVPTVNNPTVTPSTNDSKQVSFGDFVERLYTVALNRVSDESGKEYWTNEVKSGKITGADCARGFLQSPEFHDLGLSSEDFLKVLYKTFFDREPDADGMNYWIGVLNSSSQDIVVEGFIDSPEWCNICAQYGVKSGASNAKATQASANAVGFATRLYTCCLGRDPEEEGLTYWSLALTNLEVTGTQAAELFFMSPEFIGFDTGNKEYVTRLYRTFMNREPDEDGMNYWLSQLSSTASRSDVFYGFSLAPEFVSICNDYGIDR